MSAPEPPKGYRIIPREYLEAGNPLPGDALFCETSEDRWETSLLAGKRICGMIACSINLYATAEPLPCFDSAPEQALPATGDAARIAELERQLAEAREDRDRLRRENEEMSNALESNEKALANVMHENAQLAASEKDRERLDWLEKQWEFHVDRGYEEEEVTLCLVEGNVNDREYRQVGKAETLRAAIDAAMKEAR